MLEYIHKDSKSIIIEYSNDNAVSLNSIFTQLPSDLMYQSFGNKELDSLAAFGSFSDAYSDQTLIKTASIMFGKVNYLNQKRTLRANMSAGIGISTNNKYEQWKRRDNTEGGYNYSWETLQHTSVSLVLNPKLEFPFTRFIGLYLSARVQINRNFSFVRFGVGASIGILRTREQTQKTK